MIIKSQHPWASLVTQADIQREQVKQELFALVRENITKSNMSMQVQRDTLLAIRKLMW